MTVDFSAQTIINEKIIAIMRNVPLDRVASTAAALCRGGIKCVEIALDQSGCTEDSLRAIKLLASDLGDEIYVGAGTVLSVKQVDEAAENGARFMISPNFNAEVVRETKRLGLISIPGAMTPTEIEDAREAGGDIIKIFPAGEMGLKYIKAVRVPLSGIPMAAVGGIGLGNIGEFAEAGIECFGVGSSLVQKKAVAEGNYALLEELALQYLGAVNR